MSKPLKSAKNIELPTSLEKTLNKLLAKAEKLYYSKCLSSEIGNVYLEAIQKIMTHLINLKLDIDYFQCSDIAYRNKTVIAISQLSLKRSKEQRNMTVGDLIGLLSKFDKSRPVKIGCYVSCLTDAGSDLGGEQDHVIDDIHDLDTRVVISVSR